MHDIKMIRENPTAFDAAMARRGRAAESPRLLELDEKRRRLVTDIQGKQERRNSAIVDKAVDIGVLSIIINVITAVEKLWISQLISH